MEELTLNVNWIAVIAGTVAGFLLGWLWYSPKLFGVKWAQGSGVELSDGSSMPVPAMVTQLVATFLLSWLVGITAANEALATIILIILALVCFTVSTGLFVKKSSYAVGADAGFIIVMGIIMIALQGLL
ncbi:MAG: twitching motility protein PilT [Hyphomicrobiales bacterium]|nr:DUF1761 domain-containing protein [Hyphomicrobiales bacterium]PCJ82826.1 MAG: twitching motility protein PilT [Hyphomicrobiales bacterium]